MIQVLFFGPAAELAGCAELKIEFTQGMTLQNLRDELAAKYPRAFEIACLAAVGGQHVRDFSMPLMDNSEVAFMAKFSGG
jgi:molybdopterin converting factor small subunit